MKYFDEVCIVCCELHTNCTCQPEELDDILDEEWKAQQVSWDEFFDTPDSQS